MQLTIGCKLRLLAIHRLALQADILWVHCWHVTRYQPLFAVHLVLEEAAHFFLMQAHVIAGTLQAPRLHNQTCCLLVTHMHVLQLLPV